MSDARPIVLGDNVIYALPLAGGGVLLVDAGPDFDLPDGEPTWESAQRQARAHGFGPADVRAVVITHAHIDHAGLAARWADAGARILVGAADMPSVVAGRASNEAQREPRLAELRRHGCPEELVRHLGALRGGRRLRWEPCPRHAVEPIVGDVGVPIADDAAGDGALELLSLPGHTPGNLVAYLRARGDLFSGDTLLPTTIPTAGLHFPAAVPGAPEGDPGARWPSLPPFLRAVERLRTLHVRRVLPGHGTIVDDPEPLFARFEAHHARRAARIRALLASGPATAYEIARGLFPRLPAERIGQAVTEVIGHLDRLDEQGLAAPLDAGAGVRRYRLTGHAAEAR